MTHIDTPRAEPDRYAVIGNPVAHSRSPAIHAAFAAATGQHLVYERRWAALDDFLGVLRAFAAEGGKGCNVTVPFKFEAFKACSRASERAQLAQAANTLRLDTEGWWADNTDGVGLVRDIEAGASQPLRGRRILLIGAGGAAAGVLGPLVEAEPAALRLVNRTPDKASALVERHLDLARRHGVTLTAGALDLAGKGHDVVINASASSLSGADSPVASSVLATGALAVDLMYGPAAQPFLQWATLHGARARDGLGMLVEQAAESFTVWRGVHPPTAEVLGQLRQSLALEAQGHGAQHP